MGTTPVVQRRLIDVVANLDAYDEDATIYAVEPLTDQSMAIVAYEPDTGDLPTEARDLGMSYVIGVYTAKIFLEDFGNIFTKPPYDWLKCARLIIYAIYDA